MRKLKVDKKAKKEIKGSRIPNLEKFNHELFGHLEVWNHDGKIWFPATEVATILGYSNPYDAIIKHCIAKDGLANREVIDNLGRTQSKKYINEPNLYRLICRSRMPKAVEFESWVFDEVLPSIRKHGLYITDDELRNLSDNPQELKYIIRKLAQERLGLEEEKNKLIDMGLKTKDTATMLHTEYNNVMNLVTSMTNTIEELREEIRNLKGE